MILISTIIIITIIIMAILAFLAYYFLREPLREYLSYTEADLPDLTFAYLSRLMMGCTALGIKYDVKYHIPGEIARPFCKPGTTFPLKDGSYISKDAYYADRQANITLHRQHIRAVYNYCISTYFSAKDLIMSDSYISSNFVVYSLSLASIIMNIMKTNTYCQEKNPQCQSYNLPDITFIQREYPNYLDLIYNKTNITSDDMTEDLKTFVFKPIFINSDS